MHLGPLGTAQGYTYIKTALRPPSVNEEVKTQLLTQIERATRAGILIMRDFTYPGSYWSNGSTGKLQDIHLFKVGTGWAHKPTFPTEEVS